MRANDLPLATFLTSPPLSGSIKEEHFGEAGGEGGWIKFEPREGHEAWAGDFRWDGIVPRSGPCVFADGGAALVIAHGLTGAVYLPRPMNGGRSSSRLRGGTMKGQRTPRGWRGARDESLVRK